MIRFFMRFPQGRKKAFTLSYDDGHRCDLQFIDILNKYNLKSTFNLNMGIVATSKENSRLMREEYTCYEGHEVATHGYTHPFFSQLPPEMVTYEITKDRSEMEQFFGRIIRGHAYAYGDVDEKSKEILAGAGIVYGRGVKSTHNFGIPKDFLEWQPTCHHDEECFMGLIDKFLDGNPIGSPYIFYVWGHTYEFGYNKERNNWEYCEEFCKKISGHEDTVWYATNIEIYDYINAYKQLRFSMDGTLVHNPTATDLWIGEYYKDEAIKISAGQTIKL